MEGSRYQGMPKYMDPSVVDVTPVSEQAIAALADSLTTRLASYKEKDLAVPWLTGGDLRARCVCMSCVYCLCRAVPLTLYCSCCTAC